MKDRLAVYTAIYGSTDILIEPDLVPDNCDFFCFTDRDDVTSKVYKIIKQEAKFKDDTNRSAKYFKLFPNELFPDYEYSLWIDARTYITNPNIFEITKDLLKDVDWAIFKHPERTSTFEEAKICIEWKKDNSDVINEQIAEYKKDGYKDQINLVAGTFIFRRHHAADVIKFEKAWWNEISKHSRRDQLSFPYVAWKQNFKFKVIDKNTNDNDLVKVLRYKERDVLKSVKGPNNTNRIVVYSAMFGNIDDYKEIPEKINGCDFILFTNNKNIKLKNTEIRYVDLEGLDYRKTARMFKLLPHRFLPEYEYSVWIDASIEVINKDLPALILEVMGVSDFSAFVHTHRNTLLDEVRTCISRKKGNPYILMKQYKHYLKEGFQDVGLIESGVLIRKHMNEKIIEAGELWWQQIEQFTNRDQISFPYVKWKTNLSFLKIGGSIWKNNFFRVNQHNISSKEFATKEVKVNRIGELKEYIKWYYKNSALI